MNNEILQGMMMANEKSKATKPTEAARQPSFAEIMQEQAQRSNQ